MNQLAPEGARQALATGASALLAVTVAFAAWWTFGTDGDAAPVLGLAALAVVALAAVPLLATAASGSLGLARRAYALGACLAVAALVAGFWQAVGGDDGDDADPQVPARVNAHTTVRAAAAPVRA